MYLKQLPENSQKNHDPKNPKLPSEVNKSRRKDQGLSLVALLYHYYWQDSQFSGKLNSSQAKYHLIQTPRTESV